MAFYPRARSLPRISLEATTQLCRNSRRQRSDPGPPAGLSVPTVWTPRWTAWCVPGDPGSFWRSGLTIARPPPTFLLTARVVESGGYASRPTRLARWTPLCNSRDFTYYTSPVWMQENEQARSVIGPCTKDSGPLEAIAEAVINAQSYVPQGRIQDRVRAIPRNAFSSLQIQVVCYVQRTSCP
jgi:hypothetical protein